MRQILKLIAALLFLSTSVGARDVDNERTLEVISRCVGYLALKVQAGESDDKEVNERLRLDLTSRNLQFFVLAGGAVGNEMNLTDEALTKRFEKETEIWRGIFQLGVKHEQFKPYGLLKAYEIECYEEGSIYGQASEVIAAAGLKRESAAIFEN